MDESATSSKKSIWDSFASGTKQAYDDKVQEYRDIHTSLSQLFHNESGHTGSSFDTNSELDAFASGMAHPGEDTSKGEGFFETDAAGKVKMLSAAAARVVLECAETAVLSWVKIPKLLIQGYHLTKRTSSAAKAAFKMLNKSEVKNLPKNPNDLLRKGYREITHPMAREGGHRTFENPVTGQRIRFDPAKPEKSGHGGRDHYHYYNSNQTDRMTEYLDINGDPCPRHSHESHIYSKE